MKAIPFSSYKATKIWDADDETKHHYQGIFFPEKGEAMVRVMDPHMYGSTYELWSVDVFPLVFGERPNEKILMRNSDSTKTYWEKSGAVYWEVTPREPISVDQETLYEPLMRIYSSLPHLESVVMKKNEDMREASKKHHELLVKEFRVDESQDCLDSARRTLNEIISESMTKNS
jgi:hypothetical protein